VAKVEKGRKAGRQDGGAAKGPRPGVRVTASVLMVLLVGYILYGAALGSSRVRRAVCDRVSVEVGVPVEAGSSRLGFPFTMVLEDVKTVSYESGAAGFMFREVRFTPRLSGGWRIEIERGSVRLVRSDGGRWDPPSFFELGRLPEGGLTNVSHFAADFCRESTLDARELTVRWIDGGREVAAAAAVSLAVKPGELPGRRVLHHALSVGSVVGPEGARAANVMREWLTGNGMPYKELSRDGADAGGTVFLEGIRQ
jgi:hypothetical protein